MDSLPLFLIVDLFPLCQTKKEDLSAYLHLHPKHGYSIREFLIKQNARVNFEKSCWNAADVNKSLD